MMAVGAIRRSVRDYMRVIYAWAALYGWQVYEEHTSLKSGYLKLKNSGGRKVAIRISDHYSKMFPVDGHRFLQVFVNREVSGLLLVLVILSNEIF
jgi:hypothetical protein